MSINLAAAETGRNSALQVNRILAGDADAITVWKVSRFSRNSRAAAEDVELPLDHDTDLLSPEGLDTASTGGRLRPPILFRPKPETRGSPRCCQSRS